MAGVCLPHMPILALVSLAGLLLKAAYMRLAGRGHSYSECRSVLLQTGGVFQLPRALASRQAQHAIQELRRYMCASVYA